MKIAHLADLHLGFRQYHRQTQHGLNQREADVANAFRKAVDQVIEARPDLVILAGDLFHSVRPTNHSIVFAFRQFQRLTGALPDTPIVLIAGNHDTPRSTEVGSILQLFENLGVTVVADEARRLAYPDLGLSVLAVPHPALLAPERPVLQREGPEETQVLVIHTADEALLESARGAVDYGGALIEKAELARGKWDYIALGHYHVQREYLPRAWFAGAMDYVSPNPWGEIAEERELGIKGKGWLLVDPTSGTVTRKLVPLARQVIDLDPIEGTGRTAAELDRIIASQVEAVRGGIKDQVARQVVWEVPSHIGRELNHQAIRDYKVQALHFQLDLRRPQIRRLEGNAAPGRRQTLPELVEGYLRGRQVGADVDREQLVRTGTEIMTQVEREWAEG